MARTRQEFPRQRPNAGRKTARCSDCHGSPTEVREGIKPQVSYQKGNHKDPTISPTYVRSQSGTDSEDDQGGISRRRRDSLERRSNYGSHREKCAIRQLSNMELQT